MRAFIWDLDGTLLDSYRIIVESLQETFRNNMDSDLKKEEIEQFILNNSVNEFITCMCNEYGYMFDDIKGQFSEINNRKLVQVQTVKNAREILEYLYNIGDQNYIYTHKSNSANKILKKLGIMKYFKEVVTSNNGFPRKPEPDGVRYLIDRHKLDVDNTFYVGDRNIDMECAKNAGISGVLYLPRNSVVKKTGQEDFIVDDLIKIKEIIPFYD